MTPDLSRFTQLSRDNPRMRFTSLMGMVFRPEGLRASFERLAANKAPGVDGLRKADYAEDLDVNLEDLSGRLRRLGYRPKPARRVYIPKANGGRRPLGIPSFEDRIVQDRLSQILQAIWEPEFRDCSFGFRPRRSAHDALRRLAKIITHGRTGFVVEADIKGFFNHVSHDHLLRFLEHRIADQRFLRLVRRFLKAGVMEDGAFAITDTGTPQGGLVSPVLANIYLHYVLDWWLQNCHRDGLRRPLTFNFLGFTHFAGRSRTGRFVVGRKTERRRFAKKLRELSRRLRGMRVAGGAAMVEFVRQHLRGHMQYYGVSGNSSALSQYFRVAAVLLLKWLNRRSQRRSLTWKRYGQLLRDGLLPQAKIIHHLYPIPSRMT
jgi:retron-type reverse transcriptase